jgi:hypothetical protein
MDKGRWIAVLVGTGIGLWLWQVGKARARTAPRSANLKEQVIFDNTPRATGTDLRL